MPGTTPVYGLPYPEPTDLVADYPALGQDLAEDLDTILAAKLDTPGAWTSYTPTWTGISSTGATSTGSYVQIGKTVLFEAKYVVGTGISVTGAISASLPVTIKTAGIIQMTGVFVDAGTGFYAPLVYASSLYAARASLTYVDAASPSNTIPFTWATSDEVRINGTYEAA